MGIEFGPHVSHSIGGVDVSTGELAASGDLKVYAGFFTPQDCKQGMRGFGETHSGAIADLFSRAAQAGLRTSLTAAAAGAARSRLREAIAGPAG